MARVRQGLATLAFAVLLCAIARPVAAQVNTATVFGSVKDAQGGVIPGATVTLISDTQGTKVAPTVTNETGDFVFPGIPADTYTVQVEMSSFKTLKHSGLFVSAGSRVAVGTLTIDVGGATETVQVKAEAPIIQSASGERSFVLEPTTYDNIPFVNGQRNYAALATFAPGMVGTSRQGSNGQNTYTMDGVLTMDTGSNGQLLQMNPESIAEVKILTSNYQAEYGRSTGVQIATVSKSGSNQFRGSVYDIYRNNQWNWENGKTWANVKNGDAAPSISKQHDRGYSIGGPIGKPGGQNKLFFFYSHEYRPRTAGGNIVQFRVPTQLERAGDFSQSRDNNGNLINALYDASTGLPKSQCVQGGATAACFQDGGVLGKIPANRLYGLGQNILNIWPIQANVTQTAGRSYNYETTTPIVDSLTSQPAFRVDYQASSKLRISGKGQFQVGNSKVVPGFDSGVQRHAEPGSVHLRMGVDGDLRVQQHDVLRGHLRILAESARSARSHAVLQQEQPRAGIDPDAVSGLRQVRSFVLRGVDPEQVRCAILRRRRVPTAPDHGLGRQHHARVAQSRVSELSESQPDPQRAREPHQGRRTSHPENRLQHRAQLQGGEPEHGPGAVYPGRPQFRKGHHQSSRYRLRLRECGARHLQHLRAAEHPGRRHLPAQHLRRLRPGQLEGEQPADARLRPAADAPAAAVRFAAPLVELLPGRVVPGQRATALHTRMQRGADERMPGHQRPQRGESGDRIRS